MPPLDFDAFRRSVQKGEILPAYYFHGDEDLLKSDALQDLLAAALEPSTRDFNLDQRRAADLSAEEFQALVLTPPMLAERRGVVIREVEILQQRRHRAQALRAAVLAHLAAPPAGTLLVLMQSSGEKPDAELAAAAAAVAFAPLSPERIRRWIRHRAQREGVSLDDEAVQHLHASVGGDLAQLASEIAKLKAAVGTRTASAQDVSELVGVRRGETLHDLLDAVTGRRFADAADMLRHVLDGPDLTVVRLVSALGTSLTGLALARALRERGASGGALARELYGALAAARPPGLRGWRQEAERWAADSALWTADAIERALDELLRADRRLKSASLNGGLEIVTGAVLAMAGAAEAAA